MVFEHVKIIRIVYQAGRQYVENAGHRTARNLSLALVTEAGATWWMAVTLLPFDRVALQQAHHPHFPQEAVQGLEAPLNGER